MQVIEPLTIGQPSDDLRARFNYAAECQHLADACAAQDGLGREGWASTDPGRTKYHHYGADGKSACNYQKQHGPLHFADKAQELPAAACCSACDLHLLKAKHAARTVPPPAQAVPKKPALTLSQLSLF